MRRLGQILTNIQLPNNSKAKAMAISLGMKLSVISLMEVAA